MKHPHGLILTNSDQYKVPDSAKKCTWRDTWGTIWSGNTSIFDKLSCRRKLVRIGKSTLEKLKKWLINYFFVYFELYFQSGNGLCDYVDKEPRPNRNQNNQLTTQCDLHPVSISVRSFTLMLRNTFNLLKNVKIMRIS